MAGQKATIPAMNTPCFVRFSLTATLAAVVTLALAHPLVAAASAAGSESAKNNPIPPPLPVLSPTALTGDASDQRAYLRWNLQLEDERVIGWKVLQLAPSQTVLSASVLEEPSLVVRGLTNGSTYKFAVVGVLKDGGTTPQSNPVSVVPHLSGGMKVGESRRFEIPFS